MKRQPWCSFSLAGVSLTEFGMAVPSPFASLEISNSEIASMTSWTLNVVVGGDDTRKINIAAFEALLEMFKSMFPIKDSHYNSKYLLAACT